MRRPTPSSTPSSLSSSSSPSRTASACCGSGSSRPSSSAPLVARAVCRSHHWSSEQCSASVDQWCDRQTARATNGAEDEGREDPDPQHALAVREGEEEEDSDDGVDD